MFYLKSAGHEDVDLVILEEYHLDGIVLGIKNYSITKNTILGDALSVICPLDMAIMRGEDQISLGSKELLERFIMIMGFRRATYYPNRMEKGDIKLSKSNVTNNHLVVKDPKLLKAMLKTKLGDRVIISGYLVDIRFKDKTLERDYYWQENLTITSSTSREDSGDGACEVILVENFINLGFQDPKDFSEYPK